MPKKTKPNGMIIKTPGGPRNPAAEVLKVARGRGGTVLQPAIQDARDEVIVALERAWGERIQSLDQFSAFLRKKRNVKPLRDRKTMLAKKRTVLEQAIVMLSQLYAHLPFKRARYAIDPVQRLQLLQDRLPDVTELAFHNEMLETFHALRDAHTYYALPWPYSDFVAILPFVLEDCWERGVRRYLVTKTMYNFPNSSFGQGVVVTHWNGCPVEEAIMENADREPGSNPAARRRFSLARMTHRPLAYTLPPLERSVIVTYHPWGKPKEPSEIILPWCVWDKDVDDDGVQDSAPPLNSINYKSSYSPTVGDSNFAKYMLCDKAKPIQEDKTDQLSDPSAFSTGPVGGETGTEAAQDDHESRHPDVFMFRHSISAAGNGPERFGYIRLRTFDLDHELFIEEIRRILAIMRIKAPHGLIIDIRGNPGGFIANAERTLQMLTPKRIEPQLFHLINSPLTREAAKKLKDAVAAGDEQLRHEGEIGEIADDLSESLASGQVLTRGVPLTDPDDANDIGQLYHGPVALIIDAHCYSAADIFAAGFQDHEIGEIIGVDPNTGAGGANRWTHKEQIFWFFHDISDNLVKSLPDKTTLSVAIRRSTRVGANAGTALEDLGVKASLLYRITRTDLLESNQSMIEYACDVLNNKPFYQLEVKKSSLVTRDGEQKLVVQVSSKNLLRLEFYLDGRPQFSTDPATAEKGFEISLAGVLSEGPSVLEVKGFRDRTFHSKSGKLAASTRVEIVESEEDLAGLDAYVDDRTESAGA